MQNALRLEPASGVAGDSSPPKPDFLAVEGFDVASASTGAGIGSDADDDELDRLLANCQTSPSAYALANTVWYDGGANTSTAQILHTDLDVFLANEQNRGIAKLKAQFTQIPHIFKSFAHFVGQDQEHIEAIEVGVGATKHRTGEALVELHKAHLRDRRSKRRRLIFWGLVACVALCILFRILPFNLFTTRHGVPHLEEPASAPVPAAAQQQSPNFLPVPPRDTLLARGADRDHPASFLSASDERARAHVAFKAGQSLGDD